MNQEHIDTIVEALEKQKTFHYVFRNTEARERHLQYVDRIDAALAALRQQPAAPQPMDAALEALRVQVAQANGDGLLPCPFCGGQAEADLSDSKFEYGTGGPNSVMDYGVVVYCTSCSASIGMMDVPPPDKAAAARDWNRRAPQPLPDDIRKAIKRVKGFAARYQPACDVDTAWLLQLDFERIDAWFAQQPETQPPTARGE